MKMMKMAALVVATLSLVACASDVDDSDKDVHPELLGLGSRAYPPGPGAQAYPPGPGAQSFPPGPTLQSFPPARARRRIRRARPCRRIGPAYSGDPGTGGD